MRIQSREYSIIRSIDVDEHHTFCAYDYWEKQFETNDYLLYRLKKIKVQLGQNFTRTDVVNFYRKPEISMEIKFIAAMLWGHEAPLGSRRDSRGPWKLSKMFSDPLVTEEAIKNVSISSLEEIKKSYKSLDKILDRCGPNFFTKHFYFLGKSSGGKQYPLIFDDRVAHGIAKLASKNSLGLSFVSVSAARKPDAYLKYLDFVFGQAKKIKCQPDQIEYYLFKL